MSMNNLDKQYKNILHNILQNGVLKKDRTNIGTLSIFGTQIRHKMSDGFPLITSKKMAWKQIVTELLWFLKGDVNIKWLLEQGNNIWVGDAYKKYCATSIANVIPTITKEEFIDKIKNDNEFAKKFGGLGPIYGSQWKYWNYLTWEKTDIPEPGGDGNMLRWHLKGIDQIQILINQLKTDPDSRRMIVSAWNVDELEHMVLPPCHYSFQCYTQKLTIDERKQWLENIIKTKSLFVSANLMENNKLNLEGQKQLDKLIPRRKISLLWNQRSVDTFLGLPFNIASYGLLLEMLAKEVNMIPDELIGNLGDTHIYLNHVDQVKLQLKQEEFSLPQVKLNYENWDSWQPSDFELCNYKSSPIIKATLNN